MAREPKEIPQGRNDGTSGERRDTGYGNKPKRITLPTIDLDTAGTARLVFLEGFVRSHVDYLKKPLKDKMQEGHLRLGRRSIHGEEATRRLQNFSDQGINAFYRETEETPQTGFGDLLINAEQLRDFLNDPATQEVLTQVRIHNEKLKDKDPRRGHEHAHISSNDLWSLGELRQELNRITGVTLPEEQDPRRRIAKHRGGGRGAGRAREEEE